MAIATNPYFNKQRWDILPLIGDARLDPHIIRLNAFGSLYYFAKFVLQRGRLTEHLHKPICENLERQRLNYLLELPRDHFKTTMMTEALPVWWSLPFNDNDEAAMRELGYGDEWIRWMRFAHDPAIRILIVSEAALNAEKLGMRIDQHFYNNGRFRDLFPEIIPGERSTWNASSKCVGGSAFRPHGEGTFDFIGVGGALQSRHYDRMIEDDLVGKDALKSEIVMNDTIEYHKLLEGAFDGPDHTELVVGNRWSPWDLNGWIRENEPEFVVESHSALGGCCDYHPPGLPILPEEFDVARLEKIRRRQGPYLFCLPDEAPILMADWTEKPMVDVQVGDEVIGFCFRKKGHPFLVKTQVTGKCSAVLPTVQIKTDVGRGLVCTHTHKWLYPRGGGSQNYGLYAVAKLGMALTSVVYAPPPSSVEEQLDLAWLGGILDGEGYAGKTPVIGQCPIKNPEVCQRMKDVCGRLGMDLKQSGWNWYITGGRSLKARFIRYCRMAKKQRYVDSLWRSPGKIAEDGGKHKIISITPFREQQVHGIETAVGNYVAYGYASSNSHQYL